MFLVVEQQKNVQAFMREVKPVLLFLPLGLCLFFHYISYRILHIVVVSVNVKKNGMMFSLIYVKVYLLLYNFAFAIICCDWDLTL